MRQGEGNGNHLENGEHDSAINKQSSTCQHAGEAIVKDHERQYQRQTDYPGDEAPPEGIGTKGGIDTLDYCRLGVKLVPLPVPQR
ncbi:hypothetical protein ES703_125571 [subsurface metagenome]